MSPRRTSGKKGKALNSVPEVPERSTSRGKSRPKSAPRTKKRPEVEELGDCSIETYAVTATATKTPTVAKFVIPLAGVLSAVTARLYDLGSSLKLSTENMDQEQTAVTAPLIADEDAEEDLQTPPACTKVHTTRKSVISTVLACGLVVMFVILCVLLGIHDQFGDEDECVRADCIHASSEILSNLSPNYQQLDPCTKFEDFVCGGWEENHHSVENSDSDAVTFMAKKTLNVMRHILEDANGDEHVRLDQVSNHPRSQLLLLKDGEGLSKLKDAYNACMDEKTIRKTGLQPLIDILQRISNPFTLVNGGQRNKPSISALDHATSSSIMFLAQLGVSALVSLQPSQDIMSPSTTIVCIGQPSFSLPSKDAYNDVALVKEYERKMADSFAKYNPRRKEGNWTKHGRWLDESNSHLDRANLEKYRLVAKRVMELEKRLVAATLSKDDRKSVGKTYHPMTLKAANDLVPQIDFPTILGDLAGSQETIQLITVESLEYLKNLGDVLARTSAETIQAYFIWRAIEAFASQVDINIGPSTSLDSPAAAETSTTDRWITCVKHVEQDLVWLLTHFFIQGSLLSLKETGEDIVSNIRDSFASKIKRNKWMDPEQVQLAIEKLRRLRLKIGYPTKDLDVENLVSVGNFYKNIAITNSSFFNNTLNLRMAQVFRTWADVGLLRDPFAWRTSSLSMSTIYEPQNNAIVFPVALMQYPVFEMIRPDYLNYGSFGALAGHEMTHAIDPKGRYFGSDGAYEDWWTYFTVREYEEKAQCLGDQIPSIFKTDAENTNTTVIKAVADATGMEMAFEAWQMTRDKKRERNYRLPGLSEFSKEKLFFIAFGHMWCGNSQSRGGQRLFRAVRHSKAFRKSWDCQNQLEVCEVF